MGERQHRFRCGAGRGLGGRGGRQAPNSQLKQLLTRGLSSAHPFLSLLAFSIGRAAVSHVCNAERKTAVKTGCRGYSAVAVFLDQGYASIGVAGSMLKYIALSLESQTR